MGFPFLTGFYSKDLILEYAFTKSFYKWEVFAYFLGIIAAFFTAFYSFRLIYLTFFIKSSSFVLRIFNIQEASFFLGFPLFFLAISSIFIGYFLKDMFIGFGSTFWNNSLFSFSLNNMYFELEFINFFIKLIPVIFSLLGVILSVYIYSNLKNIYLLYKIKIENIKLYYFFIKKWYFDIIMNNFVVLNVLNFAYNISFKYIDRGLLELFGPFGFYKFFNFFSKKLLNFQSGYIFHYIFIIMTALVLILNYYFIFIIIDPILILIVVIFLPMFYFYKKI